MASGGINLVINGKVKGIKESIENELKSAEGLIKDLNFAKGFAKSFLGMDFPTMDTYVKRRAYDREMANSGDEDKAKAAAESSGFSKAQLGLMGLLKELGEAMKGIGNSIMGFVQGMFGVVEDIYKQMKKSSPLLEMIERLFTLAMTLFFMPLGNKLAEVMLPAIINMLDAVMDIWDKFEGKTLGEMFSTAITEGVQLVATYLMDLGSLLEDEEGIVSDIGSLLSTIGNFLADDGAEIIGFLAGVFEFLMNHVGKLIVVATEFFIMSLAIQSGIFASMSAYFAQGFLSKIPLIGGISPAAAGFAAFGAVELGVNAPFIGTGLAGDLWNMAEGGYVPATPGGQIVRIAEAGEGEYVVPESKVKGFVNEMMPDMLFEGTEMTSMMPIGHAPDYGTEIIPFNSSMTENIDNTTVTTGGVQTSNVTNNFYFEGLTNDDLRRIIKEEVDGMISQSKYRSGF
jgi:hypothetical protein